MRINSRQKAIIAAVTFVIAWTASVASLMLLISCGPALNVFDDVQQKALDGIGCEPAATRCLGSQLFTCQADHTWAVGPNCAIYVPARACYAKDGKPGCYRVEDKPK